MPIHVHGNVTEVPSQRPVAGAAVSNGELIVQTDEAGRFQLELQPQSHRFVFLSVPDGFKPVGRFYQATTGWKQPPARIHFELEPAPPRRPSTFVLAHMTDTHLCDDQGTCVTEHVLTEDLRQLERQSEPDLVIVSGDLTDWGTRPQLEAYRRATEGSSMSIVPMFAGHDGNHERLGGATAAVIMDLKLAQDFETLKQMTEGALGQTHTKNFEQVFGPTYYSFDRGGRHFVLWPNEAFFSKQDEDYKQTWLWNDLSLQPPQRPIIVVVHVPPSQDFLDQLARYNVTALLHGHWHSQKVFSYRQILVAATPSFCFGAIDTVSRGYLQISFTSGDMKLEPKSLIPKMVREVPTQEDPPAPLMMGEVTFQTSWQSQLPAAMHRAAPVFHEGKLFVSLRDGHWPSQAGVCCVDAQDGTLQWHTKTDSSITNHVAISPANGKHDSLCVAVAQTGRVYAFDTNEGTIRWESDLPRFPLRWVYMAPVIADETVYVGAKSGYAALDLRSGHQLWYTPSEGSDSWSCYATPQVYQDLLIVHVKQGLMGLNRHSGDIVWQQRFKVGYTYAPPVITGDWVVNGGDWVNLHVKSDENAKLLVLEAATGKIVRHQPVLQARYPMGMIVEDETIYVTTPDEGIQSYDLQDDRLKWQFLTGDDLLDMTPYRRGDRSVLAAPMVLAGALVVGGCDGYLYGLDLVDGHCIARTNLGSPITAAACRTEDGFCVGTHDGRLFAFTE